eukprot:scaffold2962_cov169-Amphora_coffeaeformis.AAC.7
MEGLASSEEKLQPTRNFDIQAQHPSYVSLSSTTAGLYRHFVGHAGGFQGCSSLVCALLLVTTGGMVCALATFAKILKGLSFVYIAHNLGSEILVTKRHDLIDGHELRRHTLDASNVLVAGLDDTFERIGKVGGKFGNFKARVRTGACQVFPLGK